MPQPQSNDLTFKQKFNIVYLLLTWHSRGITVFLREKWGKEALGTPCFFTLILMLIWWMFTADGLFLAYIGVWFVVYLIRRIEAMMMSGKVPSNYDGWPVDAMWLCNSEWIAKSWIEPMIAGVFGFLLFQYYAYMDWRPTGLPYFMIFGVFSLKFVAMVNEAAWERNVNAIQDAKLQQRVLMDDHNNRFGG
jgi:hypothetical protein